MLCSKASLNLKHPKVIQQALTPPPCPCGFTCIGTFFPTSAKMLRMLRNPKHPLRIPGGGIIPTTSEIGTTTLPAVSLPTRRIRTRVTGRARMVRTQPQDDTSLASAPMIETAAPQLESGQSTPRDDLTN